MTRLTPELPYLDVFHALCVEGSFTAAARRVGCTQPSISYQIRALERVLHVKLIERGGRRVLLTPAGERLRIFCQSFFVELSYIRRECRGEATTEPLRIDSVSGFGRYVLVPALHSLLEFRKGEFELRLRFDAAAVVQHRLEQGECEAAFLYSRVVSSRLRHQHVYDEELVMIASEAGQQAIASADVESATGFEQLPCITYMEGEYVFGRWFEVNFSAQPGSLRCVAHFSELEEVIDAVRRGAAWSIVPRDAVADLLASGALGVVYPGKGVRCINQIFLVDRAGGTTRGVLHQLAAILKGEHPAAASSRLLEDLLEPGATSAELHSPRGTPSRRR